MNAEFFEALDLLEKEKGISKAYMLEKIQAAIVAALKRDRGVAGEELGAIFDEEGKNVRFFIKKTVVEQVENPQTEILLEEAKKISRRYKLGSVAEIDIETKNFGRIAAKIGKNVIVQAINEAVNGSIMIEFEAKQNEILSGTVVRVDPNSFAAIVEVGRHEVMLPQREQIPGEHIKEGDRIKIYVVEVKKNEKSKKGHEVVISRTHAGLIRRLFELEVPEIADGTVEIMSIAREAGARTKMAVMSTDENVDALGACIGAKRARINNVLSEIKGEKIDLIKYSKDASVFVAEALAPATVVSVTVDESAKSCVVSVPDDQISLAIGKEGQNARLAAKLTGYKIDIHPQSSFK